MEKYSLKFHHLGLAATNPDTAKSFLRGLGYNIGETVFDPLQGVNLTMCTSSGNPSVEVISPISEESSLNTIFNKYNELIYHICYSSENINKSLQAIRNDGNRVICISNPKPALLFNNNKVSFYIISGFGMIEILEEH